MDTRSNANVGYTHHIGELWTNVGSSHGVALTGGSTGGVVTAIGDDANVTLSLTGKGTGAVVLGNSSSPVTISSGAVLQVNSTAPFAGFVRINSTTRTPTLASTDAGEGVTTCTAPGAANSSQFVLVNTANLSTQYAIGEAWVSSANEVKIKYIKGSTIAGSASSYALSLLIFRF